ncbi:MAG TPA: hypothetical protein VJL90_13725, partial [Pseudorhodoplanes sp.]|nr:hypothetical protein [Pseudorhodoplanes sp.]
QAESFRELTVQATRDIVHDAQMSRASARWYRHDQRIADTRRDGLAMTTQGFSPWFETLVRFLPQASEKAAHIAWLRTTRFTQLATATQLGMIVVAQDDFLDDATSLQVGRAWQRLHLAATALGLACQPMNQIPERIGRERQRGTGSKITRAVERKFALDGALPAFCFRMGYPTREAPHSARRKVETVMEQL